MNFIVDLIILGIAILWIAWGYHKGLTGSLLKIVSFVLAIVIAFVFFKPVSNLIINHTNWDENLEQKIRTMIISEDSKENSEEVSNDGNQNMPTVMMEYINKAVEEAGNNAKEAIVDATARDVALTIINAGVWIGLLIISRIVLFFIKGLTNLITKLPVIKQFDKLGGIIYGMIESLIIIYIILAIISFASPVLSQTGITAAVQKSFVGSIMYNNNLLLKLIF